jgi:hypothetical protein
VDGTYLQGVNTREVTAVTTTDRKRAYPSAEEAMCVSMRVGTYSFLALSTLAIIGVIVGIAPAVVLIVYAAALLIVGSGCVALRRRQ